MSSVPERFRFAAIILAAGASLRMGCPKMLLPWQGTTVMGHVVGQWRGLGAEPVTVACAAGNAALFSELDRIGVTEKDRILNPTPHLGMFSSIRCAAGWKEWNPGISHFAIALGDQPHLRTKALGTLLEFSRENPDKISQPCRQGRARHPLVLPRDLFFKIQLTGATQLKEFLQSHEKERALVEIDDPRFDLDLDTPEDYAKGVAFSDP